jgi:hypothetical protein
VLGRGQKRRGAKPKRWVLHCYTKTFSGAKRWLLHCYTKTFEGAEPQVHFNQQRNGAVITSAEARVKIKIRIQLLTTEAEGEFA